MNEKEEDPSRHLHLTTAYTVIPH